MMELWIPGMPVPAARPRLARGRRAYTPQRTIDAENEIANATACADWNTWPVDGPVTVHIDLSNQGTRIRCFSAAGREKCMRGDVDNYAKTVMDGLQKGGAFANDTQVVSLVVDKWPSWVDPRDVSIT